VIVNKFVGDNFLGGENVNDCLVEVFYKRNNIKKGEFTGSDELRLRLFLEKFKINLFSGEGLVNKTHTDSFLVGNKEYPFQMTHDEFDSSVDAKVYSRIRDLLEGKDNGLFREASSRDFADKPVDKDSISKVVLVGGSTRIPKIKDIIKKICPKAELHANIDADKAVALGAAIMACNSDPYNANSNVMIISTVPLPVGIQLSDGSFQIILEKDKSIPTEATMPFTTVVDNQTMISVNVACGVRPLFEHNEFIGTFNLQLKSMQPRGVPKIEVKVEYFSDYSFKVTAKDTASDVVESMVFKPNYGPSDSKRVQEILKTAEANAAKDAETRNKLEKLREFETLFSTYEMVLKEAKEKKNIEDDVLFVYQSFYDGLIDWKKNSSKDVSLESVDETIKNLNEKLTEFKDVVLKAADKVPGETKEPKKEDDRVL